MKELQPPVLLRQPQGISLVVGRLYRLKHRVNGWNAEQYPLDGGSLLLVMGVERNKQLDSCGQYVLKMLADTGKELEWAMELRPENNHPVYAFFPPLEEIT